MFIVGVIKKDKKVILYFYLYVSLKWIEKKKMKLTELS